MLNITTQATDIELSKNPVVFTFRTTDNSGDSYGAKAAFADITINVGGFEDGDHLHIHWIEPEGSGQSVTFDAVLAPLTDNQIQAKTGAFTPSVYFALVASQIQAHPSVSPHFTLTSDSPNAGFWRITATAIDTAAGWTVQFDDDDVAVGSNPSVSNTAAVADNTPNDYRVIVELFFEKSLNNEVFTKSAALSAIPDRQGYTTFDISSILDAECSLSFRSPIPDVEAGGTFAPDNIKRYHLRYREDYEDVFVDPLNTDGRWQVTSVKKVLFGGTSQESQPDLDFLGALNASNSLLTWYPNSKRIGVNQPEYITWYNYESTANQIVLALTTYLEDNTPTSTHLFTETPITVNTKETVTIPISASALNLATDVVKFKVTIRDYIDYDDVSGRNLSQTRTYYLDRCYYEEYKHIIYLNSFNAIESLFLTGYTSEQLNVKRLSSQKVLEDGHSAHDAEIFQYDQDFQNSYTFRSGYFGKEEVQALQELLIYNHSYLKTADAFFRLYISSKRFAITESFQFLHHIEFKATRSIIPISFTPIEDETMQDVVVQEGIGYWVIESDFVVS